MPFKFYLMFFKFLKQYLFVKLIWIIFNSNYLGVYCIIAEQEIYKINPTFCFPKLFLD